MKFLRKFFIQQWKKFIQDDRHLIDRSTLVKMPGLVYQENQPEEIHFPMQAYFEHQGTNVNLSSAYRSFLSNTTFTLDRGFLIQLDDAHITGKIGIVYTREGKIFLEPCLNKPYYLDRTGDAKYFLLRKWRKSRKHAGQFILIAGSVSNNYFMWICYFLPLLRLLEEALGEKAKALTILLGANHTPFQLASLKALGYHTFEVLNGQSRILEKLYIPSFQYLDIENSLIGHINILSKRSILWINSSFQQPQTSPKNIIISRAGARTRRILNHELLVQEFPNFESIELEKLSFLEQVRLFNAARIVISPHGAGLTNLVFGKGIKVFELYPDTRPLTNPKNLQISTFLDHEYHLILLESANEKQDMEVDEGTITLIKNKIYE